MKKEPQVGLFVSVKKKNPKPNAPRYELKTVEDIFKILTKENYKRFLKDFKDTAEMQFSIKDLAKLVAKQQGIPDNLFTHAVREFIWIDD